MCYTNNGQLDQLYQYVIVHVWHQEIAVLSLNKSLA